MTSNFLPSFFDRLLNSIQSGAGTVAIHETAVDRYYLARFCAAPDSYIVEYWDGLAVTIRRADTAVAMTRAMLRPPWMEGDKHQHE